MEDWYAMVGATIALSTFINAFATLSMISGCCIKGSMRLVDRGCTCNAKRTRKALQSEYEDLYFGTV
jgi:hypothetical protein